MSEFLFTDTCCVAGVSIMMQITMMMDDVDDDNDKR